MLALTTRQDSARDNYSWGCAGHKDIVGFGQMVGMAGMMTEADS